MFYIPWKTISVVHVLPPHKINQAVPIWWHFISFKQCFWQHWWNCFLWKEVPWHLGISITVTAIMVWKCNWDKICEVLKERLFNGKYACLFSYILPFLISSLFQRVHLCTWSLILLSVVILSGTLTIFSHQLSYWYKVFIPIVSFTAFAIGAWMRKQ